MRALPGADHAGKAVARYFADSADRLAAAITYYGFLSLFPMLLLLGSVLGFVLRGEPDRQQELLARVGDYVPDTLADRLVTLVTERAGTTGVLGLVGLVVAGLGWIDTLRESIRAVWHQQPHAGNIVVKKAYDLLILAGLGVAVTLSIAVSGLATTLTAQGLAVLGIESDHVVAGLVLRAVALALALVTDVALLVYLLVWLPRNSEPFRRVLGAAMVGAVILEVAKYVGFFYFGIVVSRGADLYGASLAAAVGLLLWINITARFVLFAAAWAVTAPYRGDVRPSGSA